MNSMRFIWFDIQNGILREWKKYLLSFLLVALFSLSFYTLSVDYDLSVGAISHNQLTFGDYIVNLFAGMKMYVFDPQNPFNFPALWIFVFLIVSYSTLLYPYRDLRGLGKHLIILSGSRVSWWLSKCIWVSLSIVSFFGVAMASIAVWVWITGGHFVLDVSMTTPTILGFDSAVLQLPPWDLLRFMIVVPLATISICLFQMFLALVLKPMLSYICTIALLFFSAYFQSSLLIGNFLMAARSDCFVMNGLSCAHGLILSLSVIAALVVAGSFLFKKMDILDWEGAV